jgi:hypothetical protein
MCDLRMRDNSPSVQPSEIGQQENSAMDVVLVALFPGTLSSDWLNASVIKIGLTFF